MKQKDVKSYLVRGLAVVIGIFMVGIAVGFFKIAEMGADPFTAMNTGISSMLRNAAAGRECIDSRSCLCVQKAVYRFWNNL